ncbi:MAG: hypothetical protein LCH93_04415 [Proteobacteria bacterium]|nr:hypothetical protein [Pseudomonadota bacterium]
MVREGQKRLTLFQRMQIHQPWCVFCGGNTPGTSSDHVPPKTVFDFKDRPKGMEFMQCEGCRQGTRKIDQVAGLMARMYSTSPGNKKNRIEIRKIIEGVGNNASEVLHELRLESTVSADHMSRRALPDAAAVLSAGPIMRSYMNAFGARIALALHYKSTGRILPESGGVFARWQTNHSIIDNEVPETLMALLGTPQALEQGRKSTANQFFYQSKAEQNGSQSAHFFAFRVSFSITAFAFDDFNDMKDAWSMPDNLFRPGFLKVLQPNK